MSDINVAALEKLIEIMGQHDSDITRINQITELMMAKQNQIDKLYNKLSSMISTINQLQDQITTQNNQIDILNKRLGIVELDSAADHNLNMHNQEVVTDWRSEHSAGFNSDLIPMTRTDIKNEFKKYKMRR